MSGNLLVINVDIREIRVALIEKGIIAELHIERLSSRSTLGNIVLGTVSRVLPGMQAAFIEIGQERAAFLHVEDLIRPDDFESYLSRATDVERELEETDDAAEDGAAAGAEREEAGAPDGEPAGDDADPERAHPERAHAERAEPDEAEPEAEPDEAEPDEADADEADADAAEPDDAEPDEAEGSEQDSGDADGDEEATGDAGTEDEDTATGDDVADDDRADDDSGNDEDGIAVVSDDGQGDGDGDGEGDDSPAPAADEKAAEASGEEAKDPRGGGGRRRRRARRARVSRSSHGTRAPRSTKRPSAAAKAKPAGRRSGGRDGRDGRDGRNGRRRDSGRISKSTPIREVVREGQQVIVQVTKEPIGTKGARVSSHISIPGRHVVYLPTVEHVGISKRIGSDKERSRLRATIESLKPPKGGIVVRTVGEGLTKKQLKNDIGYLVRLWDEIAKKREEAKKAPCMLYEELDLVLKTARDLFSEDVDRIVIDNREQYGRLRRFVQMFMPERADDIELYEGREPLFDAYGIEDEIGRALARKVPLASGGYLIIDQAEALTAIDVNTGRYVGKGQKDLEDTILQTNLEAVQEIAYQLRFRNIGGLIILDLIDMDRPSNREKVRRRLMELLANDKAKTTFNRISDLGLIEMTRKRTRESLGRVMHEPCFYCDGTGHLMSKQTIAYEILRQIRREQANLKGWNITVNAHPAIIDLLKSEERVAVTEAERMFQRRIELVPKKEYHIEQFDLQGA